jgi:hypothetical protein
VARRRLVCPSWPDFATELATALDACGEFGLKEQIERLRIIELCSCNDDFCQSFHTAPKLPGPFADGHRNVCLDTPWPGYLVLDVLHDDIVYVEVLHRTPLS